MDRYDVIVVGGGHAGSEAAYSAATMGCKVLLVTMDIGRIAQMSCNPAIGGIAKGQIVREIDALGGMTGVVTDISSIQFRLLNRSKGPAMWSPRSQCDRNIFSNTWRNLLEENKNVDFWQDKVTRLIIDNDKVVGVECGYGLKFYSKAVILTTGTFENGLMHIGSLQINGGRVSEGTSTGISAQLKELGFEVGRMKTGTPARIDARSVDFSDMVKQGGDDNPEGFSFYSDIDYPALKQRDCYITYTNPKVHEILASAFDQSPLFNGTIKSIGPRYCPSIEDKVVTFSGKDRHQLFLEPEGVDTVEYYINGFSSSLPLDIQIKALRQVKGLENVKIFRPGYAIEYDYYPPTQIKHTLETKIIDNLYFAGQINGTTGYEEAAAQGLMAGINAVRSINGNDEVILRRDQAYIGVLIDDLVTKGVDEPYRMFTSRAEYRILLRHDNADTRLSELGYNLGLLPEDKYKTCIKKHNTIEKTVGYFNNKNLTPKIANPILEHLNTSPIKESKKIADLIGRPQVCAGDIISKVDFVKEFCDKNGIDKTIIQSAEILTKYKGYISRERNLADKIVRLENLNIPEHIDYNQFVSISTEGRQKLSKIKPKTIGQASRISGISPSDISVLLVFLGR